MDKIRPYIIGALVGVVLTLLALVPFMCQKPEVIAIPGKVSGSVITIPGKVSGSVITSDTTYLRQGTTTYDSTKKAYVQRNTIIIQRVDTVLYIDTIYVGDPVASNHDTIPHKLANFNWLPTIAQPLIAAFRPANPRNVLELWGKAGHDLLGGYGGAVMGYVNLDQLHIANFTIFAELGYLHVIYFMIGILGKFGGIL